MGLSVSMLIPYGEKFAHYAVITGIFTLRTFAIYSNNWIVLSALTILGVARITMALVKTQFKIIPADLPHGTMCSCMISSRSLIRSYLLRSRNLGLVMPLVLKVLISTSHYWYMCLYAHHITDVSGWARNDRER